MQSTGARIERGEIIAATETGYRIRSLDRGGIEVWDIKAINEQEYEPGDRIYYFVFADGTGAILAAMEEIED